MAGARILTMTEDKRSTDKQVATGEALEAQTPPRDDAPGAIPAPIYDEANTKMVARIFNLDDKEISRYDSKIKDILDWAKSNAKGKTQEDLAWAIRSLETRTGTPPMGEKRISFLHRYIYLLSERDKLDSDISKYERNVSWPKETH